MNMNVVHERGSQNFLRCSMTPTVGITDPTVGITDPTEGIRGTPPWELQKK